MFKPQKSVKAAITMLMVYVFLWPSPTELDEDHSWGWFCRHIAETFTAAPNSLTFTSAGSIMAPQLGSEQTLKSCRRRDFSTIILAAFTPGSKSKSSPNGVSES